MRTDRRISVQAATIPRVRFAVALVALSVVGCSGNPPGGSCGATQPCEKTVGVCAGKTRACVDGAPEETCTGLSYGVDYAANDVLCDGLDNDCDGVTDVAAPVLLQQRTLSGLLPFGNNFPARTDAGFVAFSFSSTVMSLTDDGHRRPLNDAFSLPFQPGPMEAPVPDRSQQLRALISSVRAVYSLAFAETGEVVRNADGVVAVELIATHDAGSPYAFARPPARNAAGDALYVIHDGDLNYSRLHLRLLHADGGRAEATSPRIHSGGFVRTREDGQFELAANRFVSDGGAITGTIETYVLKLDSDLSASDGGVVPVSGHVLGWSTLRGEPVVAVGTYEYPQFRPGPVVTWAPTGGATTIFGPTDGPPVTRLSLVAGGEALFVGIHDQQYADAGNSQLMALFADGGSRTLAEWGAPWRYQEPRAATIDDQRVLVLWGYSGPDGEGDYSIVFCR